MNDIQRVKAAGSDFRAGWGAAHEAVWKEMDSFREGSPEHEVLWRLWARLRNTAAREAAVAAYVTEIYPDES